MTSLKWVSIAAVRWACRLFGPATKQVFFNFNNFCKSLSASSNSALDFFLFSSLSIWYGTSHHCHFRAGAVAWCSDVSLDGLLLVSSSDSDSLLELLSSDEYLTVSAYDNPLDLLGGITVTGCSYSTCFFGNMFHIMTI